MNERTYTEREIKALLERAAHLQASSDEDGGHGLTLAELEQIAAESGIDPKFLRVAAREAETGLSPHDVAGQTSTHVFVERTVPGTLSDTEWESVVLRLRKQFSSDLSGSFGQGPQFGPGVTEELGTMREWRHTTGLGVSTTVTIRSIEGVQHVRVQRRVGMGSPRAEGIGYGATVALLLTAILIPATPLAPVAFVPLLLLLFLVAFPSIEALDRRWRQGKLEEVEKVVDAIAAIIRDDEAVPDMTTERASEAERDGERAPSALGEVFDNLPDVDDVELRRHNASRARS
ncbi:MAG: hypothetical protein HKN04_10190 [Rhodothermaceae bacterium]|nr:hypothetical protein [Rhodothermaceae bacterium]